MVVLLVVAGKVAGCGHASHATNAKFILGLISCIFTIGRSHSQFSGALDPLHYIHFPLFIMSHPLLLHLSFRYVSSFPVTHMSNEKNPGCLGYIGDYTTRLYRDYNKPL